jgi:hypothetical protein
MCPRVDRQGQNWYLGSLCHGPSGKVKEEDKNGSKRTEPGMEREVLLVRKSFVFNLPLGKYSNQLCRAFTPHKLSNRNLQKPSVDFLSHEK